MPKVYDGWSISVPTVFSWRSGMYMKLADVVSAINKWGEREFTAREVIENFSPIAHSFWNRGELFVGDFLFFIDSDSEGEVTSWNRIQYKKEFSDELLMTAFIDASWGKAIQHAVAVGGVRAEPEYFPGGLFKKREVRALLHTAFNRVFMIGTGSSRELVIID